VGGGKQNFAAYFVSLVSLCFWNRLVWEETLLDSLLNFAATPKGLLLLQQTGALNECVSYMFSRFTKKLQVIRYTNITIVIFNLLLIVQTHLEATETK